MTHGAIAITAHLHTVWSRASRRDAGQSLVEYALILSIVSIGTLAALFFLREEIAGLFERSGSSIRTN